MILLLTSFSLQGLPQLINFLNLTLSSASSDSVIDKDDKLISSTFRFRVFGGEGAVRRGGKLNLPGVYRPLATGGAQVDVPEHGEAEPSWQPEP